MTHIEIDANAASEEKQRTAKLYRAAWRWHFYAGLYVIPFFIMLALTGLGILWSSLLEGRDGEYIRVVVQVQHQPVSLQAQAAQEAIPAGELKEYIVPIRDDTVALFRFATQDGQQMAAVDPYTAQVVDTFPRRQFWYQFFEDVHGELLMGTFGDRLVEIAASLGMVLLATGLYMWWARFEGWASVLPNLKARGRSLWKSLHVTTGLWGSLVLMFFLLSGLAWSGIWGDRLVQAWSTFPAEKWSNVPLSDKTHADLNPGYKLVPWAIEKTPLPLSGSLAGENGLAQGVPVTLDTIDAFARDIGFDGRYRLSFPSGEAGVWTLNRDSMSLDSTNPMRDRTMHLDQYTGRILADVGYADYSVAGKAMAVGMALHMGTAGWWSVAFNTVYCLAVVFLCISGAVMWWKRRPSGTGRLAPPPMPRELPFWKGAALAGLAISLFFPLGGLAIIAALVIDIVVVSKVPRLKAAMS